jgi:inosine/xanthosine triphosphate pyrophosphatase family protein
VRAPVKLYLASSNPGKLDEFRALADWARHSASANDSPGDSASPEIEFALVPGFATMPEFEENAPTFAENALGKALHYSQLWAEQSGGLEENAFVFADDRAAHFVCVIALVGRYGAEAVVSARADGSILEAPAGTGGFGYDPVFYFTELKKSFAELTREEKNQHSHRGKAFRHLLALLPQLT